MRNLWGPLGRLRRVEPPSFSASFGTCASLTHLRCSNRKDTEPAWRTFHNTANIKDEQKKGTQLIASVGRKVCVSEQRGRQPPRSLPSLSLQVGNRYFTGPCNKQFLRLRRTVTNAFRKPQGTVLQAQERGAVIKVKLNLQGAARALLATAGAPGEHGIMTVPFAETQLASPAPSTQHTVPISSQTKSICLPWSHTHNSLRCLSISEIF